MPTPTLTFKIEWEDPQGARGAELRATWARFQILAAGQSVTRVEDEAAQSVRDGVYLPLYPFAEWIVTHWWNLLNEVKVPRRAESREYWKRHNISAASEGFALPAMWIETEGQYTNISWHTGSLPRHRLNFFTSGVITIETARLEDSLRLFIDAVLERLTEKGIRESFLADEWHAINTIDEEERAFCKAVASLGLDPFDLDDSDIGKTVIELSSKLPETVLDEFYAAADYSVLASQGSTVTEFFSHAAASRIELGELREIRDSVRGSSSVFIPREYPWKRGYTFANELKKVLGNGQERRLCSIDDVGSRLGVTRDRWERTVNDLHGDTFIQAAVGSTGNGSPFFGLRKHRDTANVFSLCRAIYAYLSNDQSPAAIVTRAHTEAQKAGRAFAAEFIAPAEEFRASIGGAFVTEEEIDDLAQDFGTSDLVIRHQISNHHLAQIIE
ncbi:MAG: hypothetical protein IPP94_09905 [Ignavibacteria bacterium]|nr:hypothetical protein [Ignavibacteria bacterium]